MKKINNTPFEMLNEAHTLTHTHTQSISCHTHTSPHESSHRRCWRHSSHASSHCARTRTELVCFYQQDPPSPSSLLSPCPFLLCLYTPEFILLLSVRSVPKNIYLVVFILQRINFVSCSKWELTYLHSPLICTYISLGRGAKWAEGIQSKKRHKFFTHLFSFSPELDATGAGSVKFVIDEAEPVAGYQICYRLKKNTQMIDLQHLKNDIDGCDSFAFLCN